MVDKIIFIGLIVLAAALFITVIALLFTVKKEKEV